MKNLIFCNFFFFGGGSGWVGLGGQGGCERRIEVFVKIQKEIVGGLGVGLGGGVRVDVIEELKFLGKLTIFFWGGGREGSGGGSGWWGGQGGCERRIEVFVKIQQKKKMGGLRRGGGGGRVGGGGQGGCERRIEVFVKIQKKKWGGGRGDGGGGGIGFGGAGWM